MFAHQDKPRQLAVVAICGDAEEKGVPAFLGPIVIQMAIAVPAVLVKFCAVVLAKVIEVEFEKLA